MWNSEEARLKKQAKEELRIYQKIEAALKNPIARDNRRRVADAVGLEAYKASDEIDYHGGVSKGQRDRNRKNAVRNALINFYYKNPPNRNSWIDQGYTAHGAVKNGWTPENVTKATALPTSPQVALDEARAAREDN